MQRGKKLGVVGLFLCMSCAGEEGIPELPELPIFDAGSTEFAKYMDPGAGEWEVGTPEECKLDPNLFNDSVIDTYAVFRYGKLCYMKGDDTAGPMYSATKTLGGVMAGRAAYLTRDIKRTEPGTGPIRHTNLGTDWIASPTYANLDATIYHIMAMVAAASPSLADSELTYRYDTLGQEAINGMIEATEKCISQVPGLPIDAMSFVQQEIIDKMGMANSAWNPRSNLAGLGDPSVIASMDPAVFATLDLSPTGISVGWTANLSDMGKFGTLLLHDGWYGGQRLLSQEWVYRMSHPTFENANTAYGQLTWLNHRGNAVEATNFMADFVEKGDPCAPAAFWPKYPHPPSEAQDCMASVEGASCTQQYDVGVYHAAGMGGQLIVMHPGLDMALVTQNFVAERGEGGPKELWDAVRPGVVALDPKYGGDEEAFCADYGAGNYAPDLVVARWKP